MGIYQQDYTRESVQNLNGYIEREADLELLREYAQEINIAEKLDKNFLYKLGDDLDKQIMADDNTRKEWMDKYNGALEIARQIITKKTYPFDGAANVKIPLILQGCVQFNARIMPEIIQNNKTVHAATTFDTSNLVIEAAADKISEHMSLQTMKIVKNWISDTDKSLMALPLVGTVFRKWSYDPIMRKPTSFLCLPTEIIVSNEISSLEQAERITHVLRLSRNEIIERIRFGLFSKDCLDDLPVDEYSDTTASDVNYSSDDKSKQSPSNIEESRDKYVVMETCCYIDLDDDGYCEPYIVTWIKKTRKVARIVARYDEESFVLDSFKKLLRINPINFYVAHHWLPSPDGTFLGMGFGQILLPLNSACNTVANVLIDAGKLANMPAGFLSKDLRIRKGELTFSAGEWKIINFDSSMGSLANHIYPLPFKEPSPTLMNLLQFLVQFGKETANISDVLMGNPVNANMPATSVVSMIEQGSKVFSSILMRLYESLKQEFAILFNINKKYLSLYPQEDLMTKKGIITEQDYKTYGVEIYPVANPAMGMDAARLARIQVLLEMKTPLINQQEVLKRYLIALGFTDSEKLIVQPQPGPQDLLVQAQIEEIKARVEEISMRTAKIMTDIERDAIGLEQKDREAQLKAIDIGLKGAIGKATAIAAITSAEAKSNAMQLNTAEKVVDQEVGKTQVPVDTSKTGQEINNILQQVPNNANIAQNQGVAGQSSSNTGGINPSEISAQQAPNLPPALAQQLQQIAQQQNLQRQA